MYRRALSSRVPVIRISRACSRSRQQRAARDLNKQTSLYLHIDLIENLQRDFLFLGISLFMGGDTATSRRPRCTPARDSQRATNRLWCGAKSYTRFSLGPIAAQREPRYRLLCHE